MSERDFSVHLQIAINAVVTIQADSFESALAQGREMVKDHRSSLHTLKRCTLKTEYAHSIQDTEAHLTGVHDDDAGMMYK